jgi:hypothetical protein
MQHRGVPFLILKAGARKIAPARSEKASSGAFFKVKSLGYFLSREQRK